MAAYSILLFLLRSPVLRLLGATSDTLDYYCYSLWVRVIEGLPTIMNALSAQLIRSEGAAKEASIGMSLGGFLNMGLDPLQVRPPWPV